MLAAAPNANGIAPGIALLLLVPPNVKGFDAAGVGCVVPGKGEADTVKVELPKVVCVVGAVEVVVAKPNPPNGVEVEFWLADSWPNANELWVCGAGAGFATPNWNAEVVPLALAVVVFKAGAAVVVAAVPNWKVALAVGADVVVAFQPPNRVWLGACVGVAEEAGTADGWELVSPPNNMLLGCVAGAAGVDIADVAVCPKTPPLCVVLPNKGLKVG